MSVGPINEKQKDDGEIKTGHPDGVGTLHVNLNTKRPFRYILILYISNYLRNGSKLFYLIPLLDIIHINV